MGSVRSEAVVKRGAASADGELHQMVQRQRRDAQYQQNRSCADIDPTANTTLVVLFAHLLNMTAEKIHAICI